MISALNSDINEQEDSQEVMYRLPTLRLIFNFISQALALFTDMGKFKQILRKLVPQGEDHTETVLADGFNFFSDYILSKKVESFDITICIFNILIMIVDKVQRGPLHYQLSQVAQHVLATNFAAAKGDICRVLQEHIIRAKEPIEVMKLYVDDYFSVFVTQPAYVVIVTNVTTHLAVVLRQRDAPILTRHALYTFIGHCYRKLPIF